MPQLIRRPRRPGRRGVTLVEMLVVVALVILMMVILVQIFQTATGAMTASRTVTELDLALRQIDGLIRSDLAGVTAQMTPPNDPKNKSGYFEYDENAPSDAQGEDTDDTMAFTTKAPEGQTFTGRQTFLNSASAPYAQVATCVPISSQVAEIIYFLRNGNLYRRVLLVAPERAKSLSVGSVGQGGYNTQQVQASPQFGGAVNVSWQGLNDISCRPPGFNTSGIPVPNDLGSLTNRENRAFRPRFLDDFASLNGTVPDGISDDFNADGMNDYYPTLYFDGTGYTQTGIGWAPNRLVHELNAYPSNANAQRVSQGSGYPYDVYAFPFIFPERYSVADPNRGNLGSLHYMFPNGQINHAPLGNGLDNLPVPSPLPTNGQTWWGYPTWRETMAGLNSANSAVGWTDPVNFVTKTPAHQQPPGLQTISASSQNLLTPLNYFPAVGVVTQTDFIESPAAGGTNFVVVPTAPAHVWEDDLVLTNVRSFDIKAYDPTAGNYNLQDNKGNFLSGPFSAGYMDLGYAANPYAASGSVPAASAFIGGPNGGSSTPVNVPWQPLGQEPMGFGHEGRVPPLSSDFRYHPRLRSLVADNTASTNSNPGVNRLTRTFDTWSTDYTNAPDSDLFLHTYVDPVLGQVPLYPSFEAPYPAQLLGIQVQIRVVDPRGERSKVLTIRHDFTDKLTN